MILLKYLSLDFKKQTLLHYMRSTLCQRRNKVLVFCISVW